MHYEVHPNEKAVYVCLDDGSKVEYHIDHSYDEIEATGLELVNRKLTLFCTAYKMEL